VLANNKKKRAIHDFIAGTVVVLKPRPGPALAAVAFGGRGATDVPAAASKLDEAGAEGPPDDPLNDPLDGRVLCTDGACIGVIGQDGLCRLCGKPADSFDDDPDRCA